MENIIIHEAELDMDTPAVTVINQESDYIIFVNNLLNKQAQDKAIQHEIKHINKNHLFDDITPIAEDEAEAEEPGEINPPIYICHRGKGIMKITSQEQMREIDMIRAYITWREEKPDGPYVDYKDPSVWRELHGNKEFPVNPADRCLHK